MQLNWSFFRSKLARRIFLMFVACTLLPIAALFVISFNQVSRQLELQSQKRLRQAVKAHGVTIYERLLFLETDLKIVSAMVLRDSELALDADHFERLRHRFTNLVLAPAQGQIRPLLGPGFDPPDLTEAQWSHLRSGSSLICTRSGHGRWPRLLMIRLLNPKAATPQTLLAEIVPRFLWTNWDQNTLSPDLDFCIFDHRQTLLFSSLNLSPKMADRLRAVLGAGQAHQAKIDFEAETLQASHWVMFLKPKFHLPKWTVMVIQPEAAILWPMAQFRYLFILVTAMTFFVVLLLSINMIRRSLTPLEGLKESTRRIARKDFSGHLDIRSGDEFEELAEAFNNMSDQLNRQFNTLVAKSEIDRAILSSIETEKIVHAVLTGMRACFSYDAISIVLLDTTEHQPARIYNGSGMLQSAVETTRLQLSSRDLLAFENQPEYVSILPNQALPTYLKPMSAGTFNRYLVLPIFLKEKLTALIAFGFHDARPSAQEEIQLARQMADQVAVALANSQLMDELNRLNWGTIKALARAVDAKSSWTAGHSDRVAAMAVSIGGFMQLPPSELEDLKRAALLHDIGKLGVPVAILDKPGKLTAEEYRVIQRHPSLGARILQPINAYTAIIPLVRHHHENFDGSGYPDGIAGNDIELGARIMAVADVFDALKSDRPYRRGMPLPQVMDIMRGEAGRQFDPRLIEALIEKLNRDREIQQPSSGKPDFIKNMVRSRSTREVRRNEPNSPSSAS